MAQSRSGLKPLWEADPGSVGGSMATKARIAQGDTVIVRFGSERVRAEVLEDRGQLGGEGLRLLRVGWTPSESEERLEFELREEDVLTALPQRERLRALARIDEFAARPPLLGVSAAGALAKVGESRRLLDRAVVAADERGEPKDFELVHRYCVEELGPAALHARRQWTDAAPGAHVNPTPTRLPVMIDEESPPQRQWIEAADPLLVWYRLLSQELDQIAEMEISDRDVGARLIKLVGYCADFAAWIRSIHQVGD
jgi:hypothetical protein